MKMNELVNFGKVDRTDDPSYFIRFLDAASAQESFQAYKQRTFRLLDIRPGQRILEVGCGTGEDTQEMARLVGATGEVVGLDSSQAMLDEARQRARQKGLPLEFREGDALHLDYPDASFDASRADRTFMHLPDPRQALAEMIRVVRAGGKVLVMEVDFETVVIDTPDKFLARKIVNAWCDGFRDGWLGRRIPALFMELGLQEVTVVPETLRLDHHLASLFLGASTVSRALESGAITASESDTWLKTFEQLAGSERFFCTLAGFTVMGIKR